MRSVPLLAFVAGLAIVAAAVAAQGGLAVFTDQASVGGNTFTTGTFPTATPTPTNTPTATPTATPTFTPTPTNTPTPTPSCTAGDTGLLNATGQAATTGGNGDGYETNPANAFADGGGFATDNSSGGGDRHRFFDYNISIPAGCSIKGFVVRLDWWLDATTGTNSISVELSWNAGTTYTAAKTDSTMTTTEHTTLLGSATDTWGRTWTTSEVTNANFRVRLTDNTTANPRLFSLDWVPVQVYYGP